MRICLVTEHYPPHVGGLETVFFEYAKNLAKRDHQVRVVTSNSGGITGYKNDNGVSVYHLPTTNFLSHPILNSVLLTPHIQWADVVHTTTLSAGPIALRICRREHKPCVLMVHEVLGKRWFRIVPVWPKAALYCLAEQLVIRQKYSRWHAISNYTYLNLIRCGIPAEKIVTIYHGIDDTIWHKDVPPAEIHTFFGIDAQDQVFLYSGRPARIKGIFILLDAIRKIDRALPSSYKFGFIFAADPKKDRDQFIKLVNEYQLTTRIVIRNTVERNQLAQLRKAARAIIVPSLTEGFGFCAAECSALRVPIIASSADSLPETTSGNVLFFEKGNSDSLAEKIQDALLGNFQTIPPKTFNWEDSTKKVEQMYKSLL